MPSESPPHPDLVLGIDGGGSHVLAVLANASTGIILGRGQAGPSNIQAVGVEAALFELDLSIDRAFEQAKHQRLPVVAACLGLAGIDWTSGLDVIHDWASGVSLADTVSVANDATLLLAAGTPEGWGLAVIAGTGSIAFVRTPEGKEDRAGGWGYLLGDEGSAFQIALTALRAVCRSVDRSAGQTMLLDSFLKKMGLQEPTEILDAVYRGRWDRAALASLAPLVLDAAEAGDETALRVITKQASELALTAATPVLQNGLVQRPVPLALAGGLLLRSETYRRLFLDALAANGLRLGQVQLVEEPALGAVVLARRSLTPRG